MCLNIIQDKYYIDRRKLFYFFLQKESYFILITLFILTNRCSSVQNTSSHISRITFFSSLTLYENKHTMRSSFETISRTQNPYIH